MCEFELSDMYVSFSKFHVENDLQTTINKINL